MGKWERIFLRMYLCADVPWEMTEAEMTEVAEAEAGATEDVTAEDMMTEAVMREEAADGTVTIKGAMISDVVTAAAEAEAADALAEADLLVSDLRSELRRAQAKAEGFEKDLIAERKAHSFTRMQLASEKNANLRMHDMYIPEGDSKRGYRCAVCGTPFDWPLEQSYCGHCGTKADWRTRNDQMDENIAYDLAGDR